MSHSDNNQPDDRVERYLDGVMKPSEASSFEVFVRADPMIENEIELQKHVDAALTRLFVPSTKSAVEIMALLSEPAAEHDGEPISDGHGRENSAVVKSRGGRRNESVSTSILMDRVNWRRRRFLVITAAAAMVVWALLGWHFFGGQRGGVQPFFEQRPLSMIYAEIVKEGFRPYYECHDVDRFARTFEKRQGIALRLAPMPPGSGMLGLSYAGGLSRDTTAILCRVDDAPVVIFVDRIGVDSETVRVVADSRISVFRQQIGSLVLYEVTPLTTARVIEYLEIPSTSP